VGIPSTLIERKPKLGGVIQTDVVNGCVVEAGPDSFLAAKPWAMDLIRDLSLEHEVIGSNDELRKTYIRKNGRLIPLPEGLMMMVPTKIMPMVNSPLLGWGTKIKMALEWFRRPGPNSGADRSVADFISDHYGQEAVDYLAEPLLSGVYGGSPQELSVVSVLTRFADLEKQYGSLTRGVLVEGGRTGGQLNAPGKPGAGTLFRTLKGGLGQLIEALEKSVAGKMERRQADVEAVVKEGNAYKVKVSGDWIQAKHVVLACPSHEAARLLQEMDPATAGLLSQTAYSSSMTVALGYQKEKLGHPQNGFGFLVPKKERKRLIACTWVGTKFNNRVPETHALLRCFLGGADDAKVLDESDATVTEAVRQELKEIMGVKAEPEFTRISRWPKSMAQYKVGHTERMKQLQSQLKSHPNLHLAGNGYTGIGIPDCIRMAKEAAEKISPLPLRFE
jgi:oxygen-dependent protoporphyrinogen oxidase